MINAECSRQKSAYETYPCQNKISKVGLKIKFKSSFYNQQAIRESKMI